MRTRIGSSILPSVTRELNNEEPIFGLNAKEHQEHESMPIELKDHFVSLLSTLSVCLSVWGCFFLSLSLTLPPLILIFSLIIVGGVFLSVALFFRFWWLKTVLYALYFPHPKPIKQMTRKNIKTRTETERYG